jgi:hypothetical protein
VDVMLGAMNKWCEDCGGSANFVWVESQGLTGDNFGNVLEQGISATLLKNNPVPRSLCATCCVGCIARRLGGDDEIVSVRRYRLEKDLGCRLHVAVHQHLPGRVENADVHRFHLEIDPAIVAMLTVVESHSVLLLRACAPFSLRQADRESVGAQEEG